jgi:pyruvate-formate lyase
VENAFNVGTEEAEQYIPYGCGEYVLDHISFGSPNCSLNLLKALEVALHNGRNIMTGETIGLATGQLEDFKDFDDLLDAYKKQVEFFVESLAKRHAFEYKIERENASFLYPSMLYDYCLERGKSFVDGGTKYLGGIIETFGMVNAADSLAVIKKLVYDKKILKLQELVEILDNNFKGYLREDKIIESLLKYGNDNAEMDNMVCEISDHVASYTMEQADKVGLDYFLVVNINNYMNVDLGQETAASADGRKKKEPLANGNTPTAGNDICGVTAFLNSITKVNPDVHAGYTQNMKFSKNMFNKNREKLKALLDTYFARGGAQAMITVVSKDDLENAMKEPDKYRNLIVRVGGFSARFVELAEEVQRDLIERTLYDE